MEFNISKLIQITEDGRFRCLICRVLLTDNSVRDHCLRVHFPIKKSSKRRRNKPKVKEQPKTIMTAPPPPPIVMQNQAPVPPLPPVNPSGMFNVINPGIVPTTVSQAVDSFVSWNQNVQANSANQEKVDSPVLKLFMALQNTFMLLRPETQHEVYKQLNATIIDAYFKDQMMPQGSGKFTFNIFKGSFNQ